MDEAFCKRLPQHFPFSGQMFRDVTVERGVFAVWGGEIATHLMFGCVCVCVLMQCRCFWTRPYMGSYDILYTHYLCGVREQHLI